jgi:hypothetical protein
VLKRISATVTAGLASLSPGGTLPGAEIICLHFRLRPLTLEEKVQMPFHGELKT